jgi:hypothetical protein
MVLPWINEVKWEGEFERQAKELGEKILPVSQGVRDLFN